ncbi:MAG: RHS repeat-associated core domain-containing protein [Pyrinomonadaceae bacterium]
MAEYSTTAPPQNPTTHYTATDTLGSPRVITDGNGQVESRRDFMPFGEELYADGTYRTTAAKYSTTGFDAVRQRFTGYQRDEETSLDFAEARYYKNSHGRFTAVDPLLASGKSADPQTFNRYVYVLNLPLVLIDPNGEFPITIHVRAFAPFNWFGPGGIARGDGSNRPFSTSARHTSRIRAETRYETTGKNQSSSSAIGSQSETHYGIGPVCCKVVKNYSPAYFVGPDGNNIGSTTNGGNYESDTGQGRVKYHLAGKDRAIIPGTNRSPAADIDVHTELKIATSQIDSTKINLSISGQVSGDRFPAAEAFVTDAAGNSVFLGVFAPRSSARPETSLPGNGTVRMIAVDVNIVTNREGVFLGVRQGNRTLSLADWNKQFANQPTIED